MKKNEAKEQKSLVNEEQLAIKNQMQEINASLSQRINLKKNTKNEKQEKIHSKPKSFTKKRAYLYFLGVVIILSFFVFFVSIFLFNYKKVEENKIEENKVEENNVEDYKIIFNKSIEKNREEEYRDIQNYMDLCINGTVIDKDKKYYPSKNPKISIVITVYNGEAYLKTSILSIQNQDFKDVEIVIVDDASKDNSVKLIKDIMKTEPRIVLYENEENKGMLYTKSKGVLKAKGKYVMTLDMDDIYVQREAFSSIYSEAEKNNLDILGFIATHTGAKINRNRWNIAGKQRIIYQPELSYLMYYFDSFGRVRQFGGNLLNLLIKTDLFKKVIKLIDEKNFNTRMNYHDDFILFFLLTRHAYNIKYVDRVFYVWLHTWDENDEKVKFRTKIKKQNLENERCFAYLNFLEILFKNTNNTFEDKKIAFSQLEDWYLKIYCKENKENRNKAIEVFKLYLDSEYIKDEDKKKIRNFIDNKG